MVRKEGEFAFLEACMHVLMIELRGEEQLKKKEKKEKNIWMMY